MSTLRPRVVLVTRETELSALLARHGTRGQVEFYLSSRGQSFEEIEDRDRIQTDAITAATSTTPRSRSRTTSSNESTDKVTRTGPDKDVTTRTSFTEAEIATKRTGFFSRPTSSTPFATSTVRRK